ncbi:MAG: hypothetical protein RQ748_04895 [Elusimicrobiales bacterium]|nr:hypothetical protein [Elusimicrobiales bacterium]
MNNKYRAMAALLAGLIFQAAGASAQYYFDAETGAVWAGSNNARIPREGGTSFSLTNDLESEAEPYLRVRVGRKFGKSDISFLAAPLTLRSKGSFDRPVTFNGSVFAAGLRTEAVYRFNSYRLKYLYEFYRGEGLVMRWGGALKLRHAGVRLTNAAVSSEYRNTGFVPLAAFSGEYSFGRGYALLLDAEALGAPQGRAEDIMLALTKQAGPGLRLRAGYRMLEGGSGAGEVYTFAWLHYFLAGLTYEF